MQIQPFQVYSASAGSGKTYRLVTEFLKRALSNPFSPKQKNILSLTFTQKAASEMKERVLHFLQKIITSHPDTAETFIIELSNHFQVTHEELQQKAKNLLHDILHNYSFFSLQTIDSFALRVIRSFAPDFGLQSNFSVELDTNKIISRVVERVLNGSGNDENLKNQLLKMVAFLQSEGKSIHIERELHKFTTTIFKEDGFYAREIIKDIADESILTAENYIKHSIKEIENIRNEICTRILHTIENQNLSPDDFSGGKNGKMMIFSKILNKKEECLSQKHIDFFEKEQWYAKGKKEREISAARLIIYPLFKEFERWQTTNFSQLKSFQLIQSNFHLLYLIRYILNALKEDVKAHNYLPIFNFYPMIAALIKDEPTPYIYEKMGNRYHSFLIDEFQDTSNMQWEILSPLLENSLSQGGYNMLVGDIKQSIYRFRNANPRLFENILNGKSNLPVLPEVISPENNFRSAPEIVQWNNELLGLWDTYTQQKKPVYSRGRQNETKKNTGYVHVKVCEGGEKVKKEEYTLWAHKQLVTDIEFCLKQGYEQKDIAILTFKNIENEELSQLLINKGYSVLVEGSLNLLKNPITAAIWSAIVLQFSDDNQWKFIFLSSLNELLQNKNKEEFIHQGFHEPEKIRGCIEMFFESKTKDGFPTPMIKQSDAFSMLSKWIQLLLNNHPSNAFTECLLEFLWKSLIEQDMSLGELSFLMQDKNLIPKISNPDDLNAIRIMTTHKAKGLQFPVVIVPGFNRKFRPTKDYAWVESHELLPTIPFSLISINKKKMEGSTYENNYQEEIRKTKVDLANTVYVAFTRPETQLFIYTGCGTQSANKESISFQFLQYVCNHPQYNAEKKMLKIGMPVPIKKIEKEKHETKEKALSFYPIKREKIRYIPHSKSISEGVNIHHLLQKIHSVSDFNRVKHTLNKNLQQSLQKILIKGESEGWLGTEIEAYNEREWAYKEMGTWHIIRPDRVAFNKKLNKAFVIDYKTGVPLPEHQKQINLYAQVLSKYYSKTFTTKLVYIE